MYPHPHGGPLPYFISQLIPPSDAKFLTTASSPVPTQIAQWRFPTCWVVFGLWALSCCFIFGVGPYHQRPDVGSYSSFSRGPHPSVQHLTVWCPTHFGIIINWGLFRKILTPLELSFAVRKTSLWWKHKWRRKIFLWIPHPKTIYID